MQKTHFIVPQDKLCSNLQLQHPYFGNIAQSNQNESSEKSPNTNPTLCATCRIPHFETC